MFGKVRLTFAVGFAVVVGAIGIAAMLVPSGGRFDNAAENDAISQRIELMRSSHTTWKRLREYGKDRSITRADVKIYARLLDEAAKKIPTLFPEGTGRGDYPDTVTRALPIIWTDWTGFERASTTLAEEAARLKSIAETGNRGAIVQQTAKIVKVGCIGCHNSYRGGKAK